MARTLHQLTLTEDEKRYLAFLSEHANTDTSYLKRYEGKPNDYSAAKTAWLEQEHPEEVSQVQRRRNTEPFRAMEYLLLRTGYLILTTKEDGHLLPVEYDNGASDALYTVVMPEVYSRGIEKLLAD